MHTLPYTLLHPCQPETVRGTEIESGNLERPCPKNSASTLIRPHGRAGGAVRVHRHLFPSTIYRLSQVGLRWGCETALQGARLRFARAYLVSCGDVGARERPERGHPSDLRPTFDPGERTQTDRQTDAEPPLTSFAAAASPVLR